MLERKRRIILDSEMNKLYKPTMIWCIVCKDIDTGEVFKFRPNSPLSGHADWQDAFIEFMSSVKIVIGHNMIGYDMPNINRILGMEIISFDMVVDTLVLSRLFRPVSPFKHITSDNRWGGHSLRAWGNRLGFPKYDFHDFSCYSEEQLEYCVQDVELNHKIYVVLMAEKEGFSEESIQLEHEVAFLLHQQETNGFFLNREKAECLVAETKQLLEEMDVKLRVLFSPAPKHVRNYVPKFTQSGEMNKVSARIIEAYTHEKDKQIKFKEDGSCDLYSLIIFNPQSGNQIAERLLSLGWNPKHYTDKGNVKTDKVSLQDALNELLANRPDLEPLRCLSDYSIVADRLQKAEKWLELSQSPDWDNDGRVHGKVNPIGAGTHRCSHYDDNMANIARVVTTKVPKEELDVPEDTTKYSIVSVGKRFLHANDDNVEVALTGLQGAYGWDSRDCWTVPDKKEYCLVGADASGIQLRGLAHYMNDTFYTTTMLKGDIHEVNRVAAGISTRPKAKTFIYAWLLGAGDEKVGTIVGVTEEEYDDLFEFAKKRKVWGRSLLEYFINNVREKGRRADKKTIATIIKGYITKENFLNKTPALKRLRKEEIPAQTKKGYLVGLDGRKLWIPNEHLAMSLYLQGFEAVIMKEAMREYSNNLKKLGVYFKQVAFVHDEFQVETRWEYAEVVGETIVNAIKFAGEKFNTNCPLDGEYKIGTSWAETH